MAETNLTAPATATPYDIGALRAAEFPWADQSTWLDHASIGPLPERTRRAADQMNLRRARPFELTHDDLFGAFAAARTAFARLINADADEIALTTNTTFGLSIAARAIPWRRGDIVLVSQKEFPANVYPWKRLGDLGVALELVPVTPEGWPDEARLLARLADPKVRCLAVSLTQFANGYTVDLARLSAETRTRGQFLVVDAIQAVGQMPVDVRAIPIDILSCGAQKWLLSPWGSGFLYVRRDLIASLDPAVTGWMAFEGTDDLTRLTDYREAFRSNARRFELITLPFQDFVGMLQSVGLLHELGIAAIQHHIRSLHQPVLDWADRRGVHVRSPRGAHGSGIICLTPPRLDASYRALREARIYCSQREGALRISPHCYNTADEMARVTTVLDRLL
jgi:cysteine desulfurase/selenocysteine lyase